jgi:2'-5' RNA ligase
MARLFFSVGVTPEVAHGVESLKRVLERLLPPQSLRFTDGAQSHLTLRFLGEQAADRQEAAVRAGRRTAIGAVPFDLVLENVGLFPDARRPHTLWLGTGSGGSALVALARRLDDELVAEAFDREERPLVPHLTIARIHGRLPGRAWESLRREPLAVGTVHVDSFTLVESRPMGGRHTHFDVETFGFAS